MDVLDPSSTAPRRFFVAVAEELRRSCFPSGRRGRNMARAGRAGNSATEAWRTGRDGLNLFVVDPHTTYRRGLAVCLEALPEVRSVGHADGVRTAWEDDAVGVLRKETLTTDSLASAVRAAASGTGVVTSELLRDLLDGLTTDDDKPIAARLTDREQQVLSLIADGHPTREVAQELCYSERTMKNVLHDVVTKLNARSRSQAVAHAVREGLI